MKDVIWSDVKMVICESKIEIDPEEGIYVNCGLCKKIMIEPRQIICGYRICLECLSDYFRNGGKHCPVGATSACRGIELSSLDDVSVDNESIRKILNVPVQCSVTGCDVKSSLDYMLEHVNSCRIRNGDNEVIIIKDNKGNKINMTLKYRVDLLEESLLKMEDKFNKELKSLKRDIEEKNSSLESLIKKVKYLENINEEKNEDYVWKIDNYSDKKENGSALYSDKFDTRKNGYRLRMMLYPNGDDDDSGMSVSIYFKILKGDYDDILPWPFKYDVTMSIVDQELSSRDYCYTMKYPPEKIYMDYYQKPGTSDGSYFGNPDFISISKLESSSYLLKNDTLYIRFSVTKV